MAGRGKKRASTREWGAREADTKRGRRYPVALQRDELQENLLQFLQQQVRAEGKVHDPGGGSAEDNNDLNFYIYVHVPLHQIG
jgi:hypothetical protein